MRCSLPQTNAISGATATASAGAVRLSALGPSAIWQPGLAPAYHNEIFAASRDGSGAGAALALALDALRGMERGPLAETADQRAVLWVQDRASVRLTGRPYRPGLPADLQHRLIHVVADKAEDMLFALEEGLRCRDFACVIGELAGNPKAFNFTASRRLSTAAQHHNVPLWLVRIDATHDLSSARMRWDIGCAPSPPPRWNASAPGAPSWRASLFRSRSHAAGEWILRDDQAGLTAFRPRSIANENDHPPAPDSVDLALTTVGRALAAL